MAAATPAPGAGHRPTPPTVLCAGVLIIFEGAARLRWAVDGAGDWTPVALWPDAREADEVAERLARRQPLLVVLDGLDTPEGFGAQGVIDAHGVIDAPAGPDAHAGPDGLGVTVPVWRAELDRAPADLAALATGDGDLLDLRVPALTWLPAELRQRGTEFWRATGARTADVPPALLPPLLLDGAGEAADGSRGAHPHVRFARRSRPSALTPRHLAAAAAHAFPPQETPCV
ncbi:hypothetical protein [Streptomyces sp. NPDC053560]|uniref:hypothetical protein n=1 Tax=Streptomyces sp. NPDC053560 TaxID=3365711 RepID=UPI0037CD614B